MIDNPRARFIALALAVAAYALSYFHRAAPAAIAPDLQAAFHVSAAQLGNLAATYFYVYTVMQIPTGVLVDTLGPRRILCWGGLMAGAGSLMLGLAPDFGWAFAGRTLAGLGVSVTFIAMLKLIAIGYPEDRFASVGGLCILIGNLGSIAAGTPLGWAAQSVGWRSVFIGVGILSLLLGIASYFRVPESRAPQGSDRSAWIGNLLAVVKNRLSWPGFFVNIGLSGPFFAFAGLWAVPYLTQARGLERAVASGHVSLYFVGFAIGAATWGQISDRLGRRKPAMISAAGLHAALWWLWLWDALPAGASYPLCMALGFCGAGFTLTWACAKEVNPPACSGMATSLVNVGCFLGTAVLQPLYGWVLDRSWDGTLVNGARLYHPTDHDNGIRLLALVALFGCLSTFFIRETGCRNIHGELR